MAPVNRPYTTFYWSAIVSITLSCIVSEITKILVENRDFSYPIAFPAPVRGSPSEYCHTVWCAISRVAWLTKGVNRLRICITVSIEYRCDLENWVRGCSRSLKLAPLDRPYTTFYSYTYNGQSTESCIWSIERRHFQWPWTTLTTVSRSRHSLTLNISETVRYSVENTFCNFCSSI